MALFDWFSGANPAAAVAEGVVTGIAKSFKDVVYTFRDKLTPEDQMKLDLAVQQAEIDAQRITMESVASARQMQMTNRSIWPGLLSTIVLVGFSGMTAYIIRFGLPALDVQGSEALLMLIGTLNMGVGMVLQFWLGSSSGSQTKDWMLFKSNPVTGGPK